jgi:phenylalanyl-tRNA synthetase beta chain
LIQQIAGGTPAAEIAVAGAPLEPPANVTLRYYRCNELLGVSIAPQQIDSILQQFGLTRIADASDTESTWSIPSHRRDIQREVDLIEEVVRAYGIDKIAPRPSRPVHPAERCRIAPRISRAPSGSDWSRSACSRSARRR